MVRIYWALTLLTMAGCGASVTEVTGSASHPDGGSDVASSSDSGASQTGPANVIAGFFATAETGATATGVEAFDSLEMDLGPVVSSDGLVCPGATAVTGPCCAYPPPRPPPTLLGGGGDGGVETEPNAGTIAFVDTTSGRSIGTYVYTGVYTVPNFYGYNVFEWRPGDVLTLSATGGSSIGAFTVSAPALAPPSTTVPARLGPDDAVLTWQPDPNADTMSITIEDGRGAEVYCRVPDAQGSLTIDAGILAMLTNSPGCRGTAARYATRYGQTPGGRVSFDTSGWATFACSLE